MKLLTRNQFLVLACLLRGPLHAYAVRQSIIELTGNRYFPCKSAIQRAIVNLKKRSLIKECDSDPNYWLKARRGVPYDLTHVGRKLIDQELVMYFGVISTAKLWIQQYSIKLDREGLPYYGPPMLSQTPLQFYKDN